MYANKYMNSIDKKINSILRLVFTITIIFIWGFWLLSLPDEKNYPVKKKYIHKTKRVKPITANTPTIIKKTTGSNEQSSNLNSRNLLKPINQKKLELKTEITNLSKITSSNQQKKIVKEIKQKNTIKIKKEDIPKLASLVVTNPKKAESITNLSKPKITTKTTEQKTKSQSTTQNTKAITVQMAKPQTTTKNTNLTIEQKTKLEATQPTTNQVKKINKPSQMNTEETPIRNTAYPTVKEKIKEESAESNLLETWLPRYIQEENIIKNLDLAANQLELTGFIRNTAGNKAAIIKNKKNNTVEILEIGDEYEGLKLSEININNIVLSNQRYEKKYTKQLTNKN